MIGLSHSHLAFLKNQTSILVLLRKLDHAQIKFRLSISIGILKYAVYILYLYLKTRQYNYAIYFLYYYLRLRMSLVKIIKLIFGGL